MAPWKISFSSLRITPNTYKMKNKASVKHWILAVKLKQTVIAALLVFAHNTVIYIFINDETYLGREIIIQSYLYFWILAEAFI